MILQPGQRFTQTFHLSRRAVRTFAKAAADDNPIHHDEHAARRADFRTIVVSGPQLSSLLMGVTATHFSRTGSMLGLDFSFRFRKPVYAGQSVTVEWLVIRSRFKSSMRGHLVDLRGRLKAENGVSAVGATGRVLVKPEARSSHFGDS